MSSENSSQIIGSGYLGTLQGICKIVEVVSSFVAVLLIAINAYGWVISLFEAAAIISIIISTFLLVIYLTGTVEKIPLSWNRFQFFFHIILAVYYVIAVALVFHYGGSIARFIAGGVSVPISYFSQSLLEN
ncbi:unnamed protein product [Tenebrio molitor]|jgi:membrane-bound ClpP family serine protease|nr:unnamed protein product [Tenebrio molitor]